MRVRAGARPGPSRRDGAPPGRLLHRGRLLRGLLLPGACLLLGGASGCSAGPGGAGAGGEAPPGAEEELRRLSEEVVNDNFAANRVDPFAAHVADDVTAFGPYDRRLVRGGGELLDGLRRAAAAKTTHRWEERDWHVQVYGGVGIVTFLYEHDATRNGRRATSRNRATYVFHRRSGRWTLVHDHTSAVPGEGPGEEGDR